MSDNNTFKRDEVFSDTEKSNTDINSSLYILHKRLVALEDYCQTLSGTQQKNDSKMVKIGLMNLGLKSITLCILAVALFLGANRYQDVTLWGIGICLVIFSLIEFIDGDGLKNLW